VQGTTARAGLNDLGLLRWLARLGGNEGAAAPAHFSDHLSGWLRWTHATPLLTALEGDAGHASDASAADGGLQGAHAADAATEAAVCHQVRMGLARAIATDTTWSLAPSRGRPPVRPAGRTPSPDATEMPLDFAPYRLRCLARQQAMEAAIAPLRAQLRRALAARSPALARLAAVDAVMEQVLGEHERRLLATVPAQLEKRFLALRTEAARPAPTPAPADHRPHANSPSQAWLSGFHHELQAVLLAELELRWQPIEGLLAALRTPSGIPIPEAATLRPA
jgi:hypothetical protein